MLHKLSETIADYFFDEKDQYTMDVYIYGIELPINYDRVPVGFIKELSILICVSFYVLLRNNYKQ